MTAANYFALKTPCKECPFRNDIRFYLSESRVREITAAVTAGCSFNCHKTIRHDDDGESVRHKNEMHCAGAAIMLEHMKKPNQMMRIYERLGGYDHTKMDMAAPVFKSATAMVKAFRGQR